MAASKLKNINQHPQAPSRSLSPEARRRFDGGEGDFADAVRVTKAENPFGLIKSDAFLDFENGAVKGRTLTHELHVREDKRLFHVETARDNVLDVFKTHSVH